MLRFHSVGMILHRGLFFLSPWCASGRCLSPVRSRPKDPKGRARCHHPRPVLSSTLRLSLLAPVRMSWDGEWMASLGHRLGIFWCVCKRSLPLGKQHGNRESSIHDRFSSRRVQTCTNYIPGQFMFNTCLGRAKMARFGHGQGNPWLEHPRSRRTTHRRRDLFWAIRAPANEGSLVPGISH